MTDALPINTAIKHTDNPLIRAFVDSDLQKLVLSAVATVPPDKHLMFVPFVNGEVGQFAAVARVNDKFSMMGVFQHTWDTKKNEYEIGAVITPF